jgi:hypothetical protein
MVNSCYLNPVYAFLDFLTAHPLIPEKPGRGDRNRGLCGDGGLHPDGDPMGDKLFETCSDRIPGSTPGPNVLRT